jgi:hypothetical protein
MVSIRVSLVVDDALKDVLRIKCNRLHIDCQAIDGEIPAFFAGYA